MRRITPTTPEPKSDLKAQARAVAAGTKKAMFVASGNAPPPAPPGVKTARRPEGALMTKSAKVAKDFATKPQSDASLAKALGYPQSKAEALKPGVRVVQAQDKRGNVVGEALTSPAAQGRTGAALAKQAPGGRTVVTTPQAAQQRRRTRP